MRNLKVTRMKRDIKLEWFYPQQPAEVWECLTTPELIAEWLMPNDFKAQLGHKFKFTSKPMPGWCGIVDCEVKELIPNKKLSYTWESGPTPGSKHISTLVTWHLHPERNGTRLVLEHTGFRGFRAWMTSYMLSNGWKGKIAKTFAEILIRKNKAHEKQA